MPAPETEIADRAASTSGSACVWCGAELGDDALRLKGRTLCVACGAATTDPWPSDADLTRAYGDWYRPADGGRRFALGGDALLGRTRGLLAARIDDIAPPGPVLDVGAGDGTLLDALHARGRRATGLERDSARSDISEEPLESLEGEGEWAAVIFWHSLEHLPRPGDAIGEAARLLTSGGIVAVAVPNTWSIQARVFGDRWLHLDLPRHLVHLSARSLQRGVTAAGFEVERVSYVRAGQLVIGWLDGLVGSLPGELSLYQSLRRPAAQGRPQPPARRALAIAAGVVLLPLAALAAAVEIAARRGGTVYVEARRG